MPDEQVNRLLIALFEARVEVNNLRTEHLGQRLRDQIFERIIAGHRHGGVGGVERKLFLDGPLHFLNLLPTLGDHFRSPLKQCYDTAGLERIRVNLRP